MTEQENDRLKKLLGTSALVWTPSDMRLFLKRYEESDPIVKAKIRHILGIKDREAS